jgi:hypothetical protein
MTHQDCAHEVDVLDLVACSGWPHRAPADLKAHVAGCGRCADLAAVATALADLGAATTPLARVPDAKVVWHQAQRQARLEAAGRAARPMQIAQLAAIVAVAGTAGAWAGGLVDLLAGWLPGTLAAAVAWGTALPAAVQATVSAAFSWASALSPALRWTLALGAVFPLVLLSAALLMTRLVDATSEQEPR